MANRNYSKISSKPKMEEVVVEEEKKPVAPKPKKVYGVVANCSFLNIRKAANRTASVLTVITAGTKVLIDEKNSTDGWYKVTVATKGVEGFCMKEFIQTKS